MATTFGKLDFHVSFKPSSAFPLDAREYFENYAAALAAAQSAVEAGSAESNYYFGQVLRVVDGGVAALYQIQPDKTLAPVGGVAALDDITARVKDAEDDIDALTEAVGGIDDKIAAAVAAANHLQFKVVDSYEAIDVNAEGAANYIYLVAKEGADGDVHDEYMIISGKIELIGHTKVDLTDYAKSADIEAAYVKKETGKRLMTDAEGTKLSGLLGIKSVSGELLLGEDGQLSVQEIAQAKVTGLIDALDGKVDKVAGSRLMTTEEANKLAKLVLNADGSVGLSGTVNAENVQGLTALLDGKVDKADGARLLLETEGTKLEGIEAGAQVNKIERVKINGTELEITDKAVDIPLATAQAAGVVLGTDVENGIAVAADGTMSVNSLNVNKLTQTDGEVLVLYGGNAAGHASN